MSVYGLMVFTAVTSVLATVKGAKESWAVITDEAPTLQTLWQYALRFQVEELFLDSKSGAFELEDSRLRSAAALERLYLIAAIAILYATTQGMAVQIAGLRQQVDKNTGDGVSAISRSVCVGCKAFFTKDENCSSSFHSCPETRSPFSPPNGLNGISMTRFGFSASAP